jgi:hypothetical protein
MCPPLGAVLLIVLSASCRTQPPPPVPWFAGEASLPGVKPPPSNTIPVTSFVANYLIQSPESQGDGFGSRLVLGNRTLVVAAPGAAGGGAVWIFDISVLSQKPTRLGTGGDTSLIGFGQAIAVSPSGQFVAVGAPGSTVNGVKGAGAVLAWKKERDAWVFMGRFDDDDPGENAGFGSAVGLDEYNLVIGAPRAGTPEIPEHGLVVVRPARAPGKWLEPDTLMAETPRPGEHFGERIEIMTGDALINSDPPGREGVLRLFRNRLGKWGAKPVAELAPKRNSPLDRFGASASIYIDSRLRKPREAEMAGYDPGMLAVGAPGANVASASDVGRVHLFEQNPKSRAWRERTQLISPDPQSQADFGAAVSISRDRLVVGAPGFNHGEAADAGSAYVYKSFVDRDTDELAWKPVFELRPARPLGAGRFGAAVSASDDCIAISEPGGERVHLFTRTEAGPGLPAPVAEPETQGQAVPAPIPQPVVISTSSL